MSTFDIFNPGPWFGPIGFYDGSKTFAISDEAKYFLCICEKLKAGDFSVKPELKDFIFKCVDPALKGQAIRLFCYVASHSDISYCEKFLANADHDDVSTFIIYAPYILIPDISQNLFSLLEDYQGTVLEQDIICSLDNIFPFNDDGGAVDVQELFAHFSELNHGLVANTYYYEGVPAFVGNLTKKLFPAVLASLNHKIEFPFIDVPTLLSIWSGELCPVYYGQVVTEDNYDACVQYIKKIAGKKWVVGEKYFYGHQVR